MYLHENSITALGPARKDTTLSRVMGVKREIDRGPPNCKGKKGIERGGRLMIKGKISNPDMSGRLGV